MFGMNRMGMFDSDPFFDDFREHQRQMDSMFNSFGFGSMFGHNPLNAVTYGGAAGPQQVEDRRMRTHNRRVGSPMDPFGMFSGMNTMMMPMPSFEQMSNNPNAHTFCQSSVMTYSNTGNGPPKVYQATSSARTAPGGIKETRKTVRDSESGVEKMSIGHHIHERGQVLEKSRNRHTGDEEESQELLNLDEGDLPSFDQEWRHKTQRHQSGRAISGHSNRHRESASGHSNRHRESRQIAITDGREHRAHRSRSPIRPEAPKKKTRRYDNN
ncbi:myeloid leukemia factor 2-like [Ptychodera flava]|uniref:myeloid leukemia factor 2-like n=1 Tax=Ptychodera flava TaxID=63121 RepID=UPI003969E277